MNNQQLSPAEVKQWAVKTITWPRIVSAFTALVTMLAVTPAQLGQISEVIPSKYKPTVFLVSLVATLIIRVLPQKQVVVNPPPAPPEEPSSGDNTTYNFYYFGSKN